ncbi:MAG: hypothetical protein M9911_13975 [Saprospiraceae bacterium]|jgi:hypothetical protein|nr:hypothetical protein [Saprospiraceae bacterium]HQU95447.1 hypothetical protein [Saprospiraceae bacterium]
MGNNTGSKTGKVNQASKILSSDKFEKSFLMSALTTRIFMVGLGETKSLNAAIKYFKGLDKKYSGFASPFHFEKVLKHNGKFFWNPFIPLFFGKAFERYIIHEFENLKEEQNLITPGVSYIDLTSCGSQSRLNTTIDLFATGKFSWDTMTHKLYIKWHQPRSMNYMLGRMLNMCKKGTESWLVLEEDTYELNYSALVEKGLKGVILNLSDATTKRINHENIGYKDIPVFDLINQIKDAGLIVGLNIRILSTMDEHLQNILKNVKDLSPHFAVWNDESHDEQTLPDQRKINQAAISRLFLKSNSGKGFENYPMIFYPEFYKKIVKDDTVRRKYTGYSFENGNMIQHTASYTELFKDMFTLRQTGKPRTEFQNSYTTQKRSSLL